MNILIRLNLHIYYSEIHHVTYFIFLNYQTSYTYSLKNHLIKFFSNY